MERVMSIAVVVLCCAIVCGSYPHGMEKGQEVINNEKQTMNPNNDLFKYIQPADESLKNDPVFAASLLMVFKPNEDIMDMQNNSVTDEILTENNNNTSNNTGLGDRHFGEHTLLMLSKNFVSTTQNVNDIKLNPRNASHPHHPGVDEHTSETTKTQDQTILDIFGTPHHELEDLAKNKTNDVNRIGTEHHTTTTSIPKKPTSTMDKSAANAQTTNICLYFWFLFLLSRL